MHTTYITTRPSHHRHHTALTNTPSFSCSFVRSFVRLFVCSRVRAFVRCSCARLMMISGYQTQTQRTDRSTVERVYVVFQSVILLVAISLSLSLSHFSNHFFRRSGFCFVCGYKTLIIFRVPTFCSTSTSRDDRPGQSLLFNTNYYDCDCNCNCNCRCVCVCVCVCVGVWLFVCVIL